MRKKLGNLGALDVKFIFSLALAVFIVANSFQLFLEIKKVRRQRQAAPFYFYGFRFSGLQPFLEGTRYLGYYTDKDISEKNHAAQYAQAQYVLAPLILDLNYSQRDYILFDCTSEEAAMKKIKEMKLLPLKRNQFGIILARKIR